MDGYMRMKEYSNNIPNYTNLVRSPQDNLERGKTIDSNSSLQNNSHTSKTYETKPIKRAARKSHGGCCTIQ